MTQPAWLTAATAAAALPQPVPSMLYGIKAWCLDVEPGAGTVLATYCLQAGGARPPAKWYDPAAWLSWDLASAADEGAVCIFRMGDAPGLGLVLSSDASAVQVITVLGGGSIGALSVDRSQIVACRWPVETPAEE